MFHLNLKVMTRDPYKVCYRVDSTNCSRTLLLYSGSESEAIEELYRSGAVSRTKDIIIISINPI